MIISDLYETEISCSEYNVDIDTATVTITVTLKDFNKVAVTGKNVELKCDKGYFTKVTHSAGTSTLNKVKTTGSRTVNNDGQIIVTWTASEWGLATFSANNTKIQCHVTGWKKIQLGSSRLYVNEELRIVELHYSHGGSATLKATKSGTEILDTYNIDSKYLPTEDNIGTIGSRHDYVLRFNNNGTVTYRVEEDHNLTGVYGHFMWHY